MILPRVVGLRGTALHRGGDSEVRLSLHEGPIVFAQRGAEVALRDVRVTRTDRGVTVASSDGRVVIDLVEHLLAAIGGLGLHTGIRIATDDAELPLLDGGARRFADALEALEAPPSPRNATGALVLARAATLRRGDSVYRFTPGPTVHLHVAVAFRAPVGRESAAWAGDPRDFVDRIAPARTFGWADEHAALRAEGRAAAVDRASVIVFDGNGVAASCEAARPSEVARHKLLDLIGDLTIHGGPPRGSIDAFAPGHSATHAIVAEALAEGVLVRGAELAS